MVTYKTTQCIDFLTRTYKTMTGVFLFRDCKKVNISILFQKVCLGWKLSPITNRRAGLKKKSPEWKKIAKLIDGGISGDIY